MSQASNDGTITLERIRELISYDAETGECFWLERTGRARAGDIAGSVSPLGYRLISLDKTRYMAHRIAWLWVHGRWPNGDIDHINGDPLDNRIANLREATRSQNQCNHSKRATNKSGFKGVSWHKNGRKWKAQIGHKGRWHFLGLYEDPEEAHRAYVAAANRLHGEFARLD